MTVSTYPRQLARTRRFTLGRPRTFAVADDGSRVAFVRSEGPEDPSNRLWCVDTISGAERLLADPARLLVTGSADVPDSERALRERARELGEGIVAYGCDPRLTVVAFALGGRLFVTDVARALTAELPVAAPAFDPRPDPTGDRIAYAADGALYVVERGGEARRVVGEDDPGVTWGLAEFVAAEEMRRTRGYWWAPDGRRLAVARVDQSPVQVWHLADPSDPAAPARQVAYPAAGTPNADVRLAVLDLAGNRVDVAWDRAAFPYLVEVVWGAAGPLTLLVQAPDQRRVQVLAVDPEHGTTRVVREDRDDDWVEIVAGVPAWLDGERLVSAADVADAGEGTRRVLVDGRPLTPAGLQVRRVVAVAGDTVWFTASEDPHAVDLYRVEASTGAIQRVTPGAGVHDATVGGDVAVLVAATLEADAAATVVRDGEVVARVATHAARPVVEPRPRLLELGPRRLRAALLLPTADTGRPLPVLLDPYGGPHAQRVVSSRAAYLTGQWFADQGFAVLTVDGRGTPGRGPRWERAVRGDLAGPVLEDQVEALHVAAAVEPRLDLSRVAIRGWSFGGFLAALAVLRRPDVFRAAVAGAPVADWRLYDTHYTERYLGQPAADPEAYRRSSLVDASGDLVDPAPIPAGERPPALLVIHGLADDNVVAAHSLRLSRALLAAGRPHAFLPLPGVTHMTSQEVVAENLLWLELAFLRDALGVV